MPNAYANKVQVTRGGQTETLIDLTADTAIASDVAQGKYFHLASGERVVGTATGGGGVYQDADGYLVLDDEGGGGSVTVEPLSVTQNGTYTAPTATAYSPVTVNVSGGYPVVGDGFTYLHVNVWSELALTMYVRLANISGTVSVPIDWGDGSAIETVTVKTSMAIHSHTYASTGTYTIVLRTTAVGLKIGGSSSYGLLCNNAVSTSEERSHRSALVAAEFGQNFAGNSNIGSYWCAYNFALEKATFVNTYSAVQPVYIATYAFAYCYSLREIELRKTRLATIAANAFSYCYALRSIDLSGTTTIGNSAFTYCQSLLSVTIPSTVTSLGNSVFSYCNSLKECHVKSSTPPTIGTSVFSNVSSDFTIYVPQGSLTSYQEAENWSTYASKMQEEA